MSETADRIAKILEDPESIKMISEIAESFMNGNGSTIAQNKTETENDTEDLTVTGEVSPIQPNALNTIATTVEKLISKGDVENTVRLITALKPYMSKHRKDSADLVLKLLNVMRTIGNSNISDMARLFGMINK
ncbi:MAG: hypothetical protein IKI97_01920 [Clostridia bacterium]|nr:hypothetical protein [Clostridia bacterium]